VELYIEKKLLMASDLEMATLFSKSNYRLIHKLTKGNLRDINRLVNRTLDILEHRLDRARTLFGNKLKNKFIEMAALDLKMIHG
jgi:4-hydroxy-tetrahydrodipicolinate synthase